MKYKDYYATLEVERTASDDEIKKAYRRLARKYHPDVSKEPKAEERFKEIGEAYETLKDPQKRRAYDQLGRFNAGDDFRPPPGWEQQFGNVDLGDLFGELFGGMGGGMRGARGGARRGARGGFGGGGFGTAFGMPGQDVEANVQVDLDQVQSGAELTLDLGMPGDDARRSVRVRIPKGATEGDRLRIPGKGMPGSGGAAAGDLYLNIALKPHPVFRASGHDLTIDVPVTPWEAALGATIEVPTLDGRVRLGVKPGTRGGQKLRIAGKGLERRDGSRGDLFAVLTITTPTVLSDREKALYEELAKASSFNPRAHFEA